MCPSLTALSYYYFTFVDYDQSSSTIFYKVIVGITMTFLFLVLLNESWFISTIVYVPFLAYFMVVTGEVMVKNQQGKGELIARCAFCSFIFAVVAYHIEKLNKQAFLGRETGEKTFHRWLKIFDTFPEGLALIKGGDIVYSNRSLFKLFELKDSYLKHAKYYDELRNQLQTVKLRKLDLNKQKDVLTVWEFLTGEETGAAFELEFVDPVS